MKRFLATILAVIYFSVSSGMVVNIHYCMGKLSSAKLAVLPGKKCACGMSEKKGCCRTEAKLVKIDDAQKASYAGVDIQLPAGLLPYSNLNLLQTPFYNGNDAAVAVAHAPPLLSRQDTYLQNCVFRI